MTAPAPPTPREPAAVEADARDLLASLTRLEREIVELRYTQRLDATERVREALRRLADAGPPAAVLERAAAELGGATSFELVAVSRVRDGALVPLALWTAGAAMAPATPPAAALEPGTAEAEVARTRRSAIVDGSGAAAAPPGGTQLAWRAYVLAAVALRGEVVALQHAGGGPQMRELVALDRELVAVFAAGLEDVLERSALEQALRRHRGALAAAARFVERRLEGGVESPAAPPVAAPAPAHDPLTARELEVLAQLAQGRTNRAAADALAISEGTVKYHVKNILRKLHARSRADAVARHLRAAGAAPGR